MVVGGLMWLEELVDHSTRSCNLCRRRIIKNDKSMVEAPWVTDEIRTEIKSRQQLNRERRNCVDTEQKKIKFDQYIRQKIKVQTIIKREMERYELKITNDIKEDKSRGKKLWDNINKLRGKATNKKDTAILYDADEQPLNMNETETEIKNTGKQYTINMIII